LKRCGGPHLARGPLFAHPCSSRCVFVSCWSTGMFIVW